MRVPAVIFSLILFVMLGWTRVRHSLNNSGTVVRNWNQLALDSANKNASDAQAARLYAMVNVAIYDAVNGIASRHGSTDRDHALVPPDGAQLRNTIAAAASAAHAVLIGLYPDLAARFDAQLASDLSGLRGSGRCRRDANGVSTSAQRSWPRGPMTAQALTRPSRLELVRDSSGQPGPARSFAIYCHSRLLIQAFTSVLGRPLSTVLSMRPPWPR
jgi:hypothetical protein